MILPHISDPCPMKTAQFTPAVGGHHCASCNKVVIDFRGKSNEEITAVLHSRYGQKTCGVFHPKQVTTGFRFQFSVVRFAAALLLVFGSLLFSGCSEPEVAGDVCMPPDSTADAQIRMQMQTDSTHLADSMAHVDSAMKGSHGNNGQ